MEIINISETFKGYILLLYGHYLFGTFCPFKEDIQKYEEVYCHKYGRGNVIVHNVEIIVNNLDAK